MPRAYVSYANAYNATTPTIGLARGDYARQRRRFVRHGQWRRRRTAEPRRRRLLIIGRRPLNFDGIAYVQSVIRMAHITDGSSNTYFVGEKYLNPDHYDTESISPTTGVCTPAFKATSAAVAT